jgi:hypothetical protein
LVVISNRNKCNAAASQMIEAGEVAGIQVLILIDDQKLEVTECEVGVAEKCLVEAVRNL